MTTETPRAAQRDEQHPVTCSPRSGEADEYVTLDYAVQRVSGYYEMEPATVRDGLLAGQRFQTISFTYVLAGK